MNVAAFRIAADTASTGLELSSDFTGGYIDRAVGGTSRMYISSLGRVGIGTTSPTELLTVGPVGSGERRLYVSGKYNFDGAYLGTFGSNGGAKLELAAHTSGSNSASWRISHDFDTSGEALVFSKAASAASYAALSYTERLRIDSSGRLLVGTSSARSNFTLGTPTTQFETATSTFNQGLSIINNGGTVGYDPTLTLGVTRGTSVGSNTAIPSAGYGLGRIDFAGADGTTLITGARIAGVSDGTWGTNDAPSALVFSTTADGASSPTERMRIQANGRKDC
jgi:hypothetical protein